MLNLREARRGNTITYLLCTLTGAVLSTLLMGAGAYMYSRNNSAKLSQLSLAQYKGEIKVPSPESGNAIVWAVRKAGPAAVAIETRSGRGNLLDPFRDMIEGPMEGRGSGVIIDGKNGYVLTNAHVVQDATTITCQLLNEMELQGSVVGADTNSDIAVIKLNGSRLPEAPLGSSDNLQIGEWAIAIGNPLGNQHTVTVGVVSAIRERINAQSRILPHVIQTDAPINPGNSGGPLCNIKGEVIGINTAIIQSAQGIGYAIPIDTAMRVARSLIRGEEVPRPWIGVTVKELTPEERERYKLPEDQGLLVSSVEPGSPASRAGLKENDVILEIDRRKIDQSEELVGAVKMHEVGERLTVLVQRKGVQLKPLSVTVGNKPSQLTP